jgi:5'-deoxynucleotidase YfbR-like HD superfamily hydrolase
MDKQKQIEEMEQYLVKSIVCSKSWKPRDIIQHLTKMIIPEGAVVLMKEEFEDLKILKDFDYGYHNGESNMKAYYENIRLPEARKETAEKFAEMAKEKFAYDIERCKVIDEICKDVSEVKS